jgi:DUF1680 family protein/alpha-L-arabinofuranosidase
VLDTSNPFNGKVSQLIRQKSGDPCTLGISQGGKFVKASETLRCVLHLRAEEVRHPVCVALWGRGKTYASAEFRPTREWERYEATLTPTDTDNQAVLTISFRGPGSLWIDQVSLMPVNTVHGWRTDVAEALKALRPGIIRFGGSTTEGFDWTATIGDPAKRVPFTTCWGGLEPGNPGIEEFVQLCRWVDAEPLICVRFSGKKPKDAADEVEYFNGSDASPMGKLRAANGHAEPYRVKYWQIGNELGDETYQKGLAEFCKAMKAVDPTIKLMASFPSPGLLDRAGQHLDYICPHHYGCHNLPAMEADVERCRKMIAEHAPGRDIRLGITEWNTTAGDFGLGRAMLWTLDNALACSRYQNLMHRHCDLIEIANRSNLADSFCSGVIQTNNSDLFKTPTYYAQQLYAVHAGCYPLKIEGGGPQGAAVLDASATISADGKRVAVFAVNPTIEAQQRTIDLAETAPLDGGVDVWTLADTAKAPERDAANSWREPDRIRTEPGKASLVNGKIVCEFPALSLTVLEIRCADSAAGRIGENKEKAAPVVTLQAEPFRLQDVRLLDGPFKHAMELDRKYLLSLDADRLLHVFRLRAGLPSTAKPYGGWMAPDNNSRGEFVGLYLSACAEMYAGTADEQVKKNADQVVAGLAECQRKIGTGFLHTHADTFTSRCETPVPFWYQIHKVMAGLMDMYLYCDNRQALEIAGKLGDWACTSAEKWTDAQMQKMLEPEHGGINEAMANLYALTGGRKYLKLALRLDHMAVIGPASQREDRLTGLHANTQIPKFIGAARQYELTGQPWLKTAATFFWETVVNERSYVIGGNSLGEYFTGKEKLSQALGLNTCETCNTYNMLKLTRHLFFWELRLEYADYYERALYNQILGSQNPDTGMMCYFTPLVFDPKCRKEYCSPEDSFWCCTGTGIENHAKYGDSIYFRQGATGLYVNLFIASELSWCAKGLALRQETKYPEEAGTRLVFACAQPVELNLHIRRPSWATAGFTVRINGVEQPVENKPGSYATVAREWRGGDIVEVSMPFTLRTEAFRDNPRRLAFLHGPLVLCADTQGAGGGAPCPVIAAEEGQILGSLKPVPGKPSTFIGPSQVLRLSKGPNPPDVTLEPLYRMHGNRSYVVYWDLTKPN